MGTARLDFPQTWCQGAIARREITPPVGAYHRMWGAATHDRSTGVHRPLEATALVLRASGAAAGESAKTQAIVSIDHCLLWTAEMEALRTAVCEATGLAREQLHITMTHTHAAGLMDPSRADLPGGELIGPYLDELARRVAESVSEALGSIRPLRIVYGYGRSNLATNRDFRDEQSGQFVCGFNPDGASDDTLLVARLTDESGRTVGTLVNYACHPTTLAWDNTLVSPDYVGALRETVETATAAPCLFLQGASGDLGPREGFVGDVAVADRNGRQLGYAALAALESLPAAGLKFEYSGPVISGATIGAWAYAPLSSDELCEKHRWHTDHFTAELPYREGLPTRDETKARLVDWQAKEIAARAAGDVQRARDARAEAERMTRQWARIRSLPPGDHAPVPVQIWRLGDAVWLTLAGEHYHVLQKSLRAKFAGRPLVITTLTDGWLPGYVPAADTYGQGIYPESIAVVAPGSLETLIDTLASRIEAQLATS